MQVWNLDAKSILRIQRCCIVRQRNSIMCSVEVKGQGSKPSVPNSIVVDTGTRNV
jgi:hypothetical protein